MRWGLTILWSAIVALAIGGCLGVKDSPTIEDQRESPQQTPAQNQPDRYVGDGAETKAGNGGGKTTSTPVPTRISSTSQKKPEATPAGDPPPEDIDRAFDVGTKSEDARSSYWAVEPFDNKPQWIQKDLRKTLAGVDWGRELRSKLTAALTSREINAGKEGAKLDAAQIQELIEEKDLKIVIGGRLNALGVSDATATLDLQYTVRKRLSDAKTVTYVQARPLQVAHDFDAASFGVEHMHELIDKAASTLAEKIVVDVPTDVIAEKG